ncbi:DUF3231 family protein [Sporomusa sp.]|uniref:DUF3231 family protein n=1 Tax=Sporomusa sp. TaxID=2078658 RepID=UPI002CCBC7CF|nr:DUF3231 family protein [Sporomusa sp.]HWR44297.1 DUF3231 family protein [Sporomusa sp.]
MEVDAVGRQLIFVNIFEVIHDSFEPFLDGEKRALNVMEATNLWFFLAISETTMRNEEVAYNLAQDQELKDRLWDAKASVHQPIAKEIQDFLLAERVPLPKGTPPKPVGDFQLIPEGAKLNDEEIANLMSFNLLLGINYASRGLTESIRADVGLIFFKVIVRKTIFGATLKKLMDQRGWLHDPPVYKS